MPGIGRVRRVFFLARLRTWLLSSIGRFGKPPLSSPLRLLALSSIHERKGDFERARELSERASDASLIPGTDVDTITHAKLANLQAAVGDAYAEVGELREAIDAYRKALDRRPDFHDIRHRLGVALREAGLPHQASLEFKRVLRGNPALVDSQVQLGLTYYSLGRPNEAAHHWREASAADPERNDIRLYLRLLADVTPQGGSNENPGL